MPTSLSTTEISNNNGATVETVESTSGVLIHVDPKALRSTPSGNYRRKRNSTIYEELKVSIQQHGMLQNIIVRNSPVDNALEVLAGYGRWNIALELGLSVISCLNKGVISDAEALEIALSENNNRDADTLGDRIELAKGYLGLSNGDHKTAALRLGVSEVVYREYLQLGRCHESLIDALDDNEHPLKKGHCMVLSQFPTSLQVNTLARITAEPNKYTVKYLKSRAKNFEHTLADAKFCTKRAGCDSCQHNSKMQFDAFAQADEMKCANPECFISNQKKWLALERIPVLEEQHGIVLTTQAKPLDQVAFCDPALLGEDQVRDCKNCSNCIVLVSDAADTFGQAWGNVCIDTTCHSKYSAIFKAEQNTEKEADQQTENLTKTVSPKPVSPKAIVPPVKTNTNTNKPAPSKISKKIQRTYSNMLQEAFSELTIVDETFNLALIVKAVANNLRESNAVRESIPELMALGSTELQIKLQDLIQKFSKQLVPLDSDAADKSGFNANEVIRKSFKIVTPDDADQERIIVNSWKPTKTFFDIYNITQLSLIAEDSGFKSKYEAENGEKSWDAICSKRKADIISMLISFDFDWSNYAPKSYVTIGKNYIKPE